MYLSIYVSIYLSISIYIYIYIYIYTHTYIHIKHSTERARFREVFQSKKGSEGEKFEKHWPRRSLSLL
jgi:hypothetical protein